MTTPRPSTSASLQVSSRTFDARFRVLLLVLIALPAGGAALRLGVGGLTQQQASRVDVTIHEGTNLAIALSPDGAMLALDLLGSLWTMPVTGGAATRISDEHGDIRQPVWSPDGRAIAFQSYRDGNWHIWRTAVDGSELIQLTFGAYDDREPHWSPDGARIAFSSDRSGNYDIWELDLGSGALRAVTTAPGDEWGPAYSPDGAMVAYASDRERGTIWTVGSDGVERLHTTAGGPVNAPSWRPDGSAIVFNAVRGGSSDLRLGERALTSGEDVFPFRVQWITPAEFLYTADGRIRRRRIDGSTSTDIAFSARVVFERHAYTRRVPDLNSRAGQPVRGIVSPTVSPDGRSVAFVALGDLWVMPIGQAPRRLTNDSWVEAHPDWSPDGTRLVFSSDRAGTMDLWIHELASGQQRALTRAPGGEVAGRWSPDGTRIAFQNESGRVLIGDVATGETREIHRGQTAPTLFAPGRPTWSPDGRLLAVTMLQRYSGRFREGTSQILLLDVQTGEERRVDPVPHHSIGRREDDGPVWSRDGRHLAFAMDGTLWVLPVTSRGEPVGPPRRLTDELIDAPSWTADGNRILFATADGLRFISLLDGRTENVPVPLAWQRPALPEPVVVHAGRLFDGLAAEVLRDVDIVLENGRISEVAPHGDRLHRGRVIDASSGTVIPGLIEMHSHLSDGAGEALGRTWLAYGITTVREPASSPWEAVGRREAVESGRRIGPRIFSSGYPMDGTRIYYSGMNSITAGPQLEREIERIDALGLDVVKTYVRLSDGLQRRAIEIAHGHGLRVTSHELYPAVAYGADGVEHIRGTSRRGYSTKISALSRSYGDVVTLLGASGMTITPTVGIQGGFDLIMAKDPTFLEDARLSLFPAPLVPSLRARGANAARDLAAAEARVAPQGALLRAVLDAGGRIVAGTDSPIIPFGLSLHAELQAYVEYGLSPVEALRAATSVAADALGADLGVVAAGRLADLVVVDGDPLQDIRDARKVRIVIRGGIVHTVEELLARPPIS
ncbi:MAG: amidohydrolase family protein [Gemmatimonadetes bacterium]|nr:amidohydrolase family protein [Gemmatimonadota bacterium]